MRIETKKYTKVKKYFDHKSQNIRGHSKMMSHTSTCFYSFPLPCH